MTRTISIILAGLLLGASSVAQAQSNAAPANVVTPAPAPREGTVGPEQLRDFALPGTRQAAPPADASRQAPAPAPVPRATPPAVTTRPVAPPPVRAESRVEPPPVAAERPAAVERAPTVAPEPSPSALSPAVTPPALPIPQASEPLPPITVTQSGTEASSLLPGWWPWLLVAVLAGVGLALALRQRRKPAVAGHRDDVFERVAPEPAAASPAPFAPSDPAPAPRPAPAPALPTGMVTTRLRPPPAAAPPPAPPPPAPPPVVGGVVSTRLRGWVGIELVVREILFSAEEALLRVDLIVTNEGSAAVREVALEAVTTNGGENQGAEIAAFFARPPASVAAIAELGPLSDAMISHELKMPRSAIRAYEAQGRTLFVPVVVLNVSYRTASVEGRTSAAFLVGRDVPGSEKLAPLLLAEGPGRLLGLGVRRLEEAARR